MCLIDRKVGFLIPVELRGFCFYSYGFFYTISNSSTWVIAIKYSNLVVVNVVALTYGAYCVIKTCG